MTSPLIYLDDHAITRDEVLLRGRRAASGFDALGVSEGDTVALLLRNDFAFFEVQQAAAAVGGHHYLPAAGAVTPRVPVIHPRFHFLRNPGHRD